MDISEEIKEGEIEESKSVDLDQEEKSKSGSKSGKKTPMDFSPQKIMMRNKTVKGNIFKQD